MSRELHPRIKIRSEEDQKRILAELKELNKVTKIIWDALVEANKAFEKLDHTEYAFVQEKRMRLQRLLEDTQQGINETIFILP